MLELELKYFLITIILIIFVIIFIFTKQIKDYLKQIFKILIKNINLIYKYNKFYIIISILFSIFKGILPIISILLLQKIINLIQLKNITKQDFLFVIFSYIFLEIVGSIATEFYNLYSSKFSKRFSKDIEIMILEKASKLTTKDFENSEIYDLINRAQSQNGNTIITYVDTWISVLEQTITIISSCILIFYYKYWILFLIVLFPFVRFYYLQKLGKQQYTISIQRTSDERKCWYINYLMLLGNSVKETIIYGLGTVFISKYKKLKETFILQDYKIIEKEFIINSLTVIISQIILGYVFVYIFLEGFYQHIYLGDVTTYTTCITMIKNGIESILLLMNVIYSRSLYLELLFKFFDIPESKNNDLSENVTIDNIEHVELRNVSYRFSENSDYVLKNINITLRKNEIFALVGRNGSGKSTLIKIILGLYTDYEGEIFINGINFRNIDKNSYYKKVSCVFQDYTKYEASIKENVGYGDIDQIDNEDLITNLLLNAGIDINKFGKNKLNTVLGHWFGETQLSEGQWQKIATSRAMMKNSDFYILDEPDAALDAISEIDMIKNYKFLLKNKLGIIISHKIYHLNKLCDYIIVLKDGEISDIGTHKELINKKNIYYELFISQSFN